MQNLLYNLRYISVTGKNKHAIDNRKTIIQFKVVMKLGSIIYSQKNII